MNQLQDIIIRVGKIVDSYPNLGFTYVFVSLSSFNSLLHEYYNQLRCYTTPLSLGFQSLTLQTCQGPLYVKIERGIEDDDFILSDMDGNRYSYKHFFVNNIMEKIVLRGDL